MLNRLLAPALAVAMLAGTPVFAQPAPDSAPAAPRARAHGGEAAERLQRVHDRLGITPAQQPQWDAVVAAIRDNAQAMRADPARRAERAGNLNAVQELRTAADLAHSRADAIQRMIPPVEALYASLSPEQQRTADQVLAEAMHHGKHRG